MSGGSWKNPEQTTTLLIHSEMSKLIINAKGEVIKCCLNGGKS